MGQYFSFLFICITMLGVGEFGFAADTAPPEAGSVRSYDVDVLPIFPAHLTDEGDESKLVLLPEKKKADGGQRKPSSRKVKKNLQTPRRSSQGAGKRR